MVPKGLDFELATMQNIATALGQLEPSARARTLYWLRQRFHDDTTPVTHGAPGPAAFSPLRVVPTPVSASDELLSVETLGDLFDPRQETPAVEAAEAAPQTVTGMLTEFVAEFQQIAREWDDACSTPAEAHRPVRLLSAAS